MNILLITDEVWDDKKYSNNVLSNWFEGFPANFANLYLAHGVPNNSCCQKYYQVTDQMMALSLITGKEAGHSFLQGEPQEEMQVEEESQFLYSTVKSFTTESMRLIRDLIWMYGKYNERELYDFVTVFAPDLVFSLRMASKKMLRIERIVAAMVPCPMIVFTGDDEYTLKQIRVSPIYWLRRIGIRRELRNNADLYEKYYTLSKAQANLYRNELGVHADVLMKCGEFPLLPIKPVNPVIRIVYGGRVYCNRYKTLKKLRDCIEKVNYHGIQVVLDIYTKEMIPKGYKKWLDDGIHSQVHLAVSAEELKAIYQQADIALHVESFDLKNRYLTKYSFSTKIIDCLGSTCAVMAICPKDHTGYTYLKKQKAAICISNVRHIRTILLKILKNPEILERYQYRAWSCGHCYHQKERVQKKMYREFSRMIRRSIL